jgi:hypothetical protein
MKEQRKTPSVFFMPEKFLERSDSWSEKLHGIQKKGDIAQSDFIYEG